MNVTFNVELDSKANKKGEKLLMIRCTLKGQHRRVNTGIHILPKFWDYTKKQVKRNHTSASDLNNSLIKLLQNLETNYHKLLNKKEDLSLAQIIKVTEDNPVQNFYDFAVAYKLNQFLLNKKMGTYRRYEAVLNKLKTFAGKSLTINQVTYTLLRDFERHLLEIKKNSRDTTSSNLSVLRSILNEAIRHGLYVKRNPFDSLSLTFTDNTKEKLTIEELKKFNNVSLPNITSLYLAKDFFMSCFFAGGCRAGDMVMMTWANVKGSTFSYTQQKTGRKLVLPILPELQKIFDKYISDSPYIFPFLKENEEITECIINSKITYINKYLKEVCKYAGIIKKISTHCSRHSFSDISLYINGNDIYALRDVLGHVSVKTTEGYLKMKNYSSQEEYLKKVGQFFKDYQI